jgi:hypothetical protein
MQRRTIMAMFVAPALLVALVTSTASAYNLYTLDSARSITRWSSLPVSYEINATLIPYMSNDLQIMQTAFASWSNIDCTNFASTYTGTTNSSSSLVVEGSADGHNRLVFVSESAWPQTANNALAVTQTQFEGSVRGWEIGEADIAFNGGVNWSSNPSSWEFDLQSVATHEIGHLLGMQHTPTTAATMYYACGPGETGQRSLHNDDMAGVCFLYPQGGAYTCSSNADCPDVESENEYGQKITYGRMSCLSNRCQYPALGDLGGQGDPCATYSDCQADLFCAGYCTGLCNVQTAPNCPAGFECLEFQDVTDGEGACLEEPTGDVPFDGPCDVPGDCISNLCIDTGDGAGVCADYCRISASDCPVGGICLSAPGGAPDEGWCIPEGDSPPGTVCESAFDCPGGYCFSGSDGQYRCKQPCEFGLDAVCPASTACVPTEWGDVCFDAGASPLGTTCLDGGRCQSLLCLTDPNTRRPICSELCSGGSCPSGYECVPLAGDSLYSGCFPVAASNNNTPANNTPANNTPANNTPANNTSANNPPANNTPANNTPANNTPANNGGAFIDDPFIDDSGGSGGGGGTCGVAGEASPRSAYAWAVVVAALAALRLRTASHR